MANGTELGKAYVQIIPSAQGISGQISGLLGGEVSSAGQSAGTSLGGALVGALSGVIAAAGIGKLVTDSIMTGMDFDKSMSQVAATMGTTVDQIGELRDFAKEMGASTAFSATEAADALNYMALAGYDAETSMNMLPNVLNLAAAGSIDLASASDMVTDAQTALGLSLDETSIMVDQMAKASSKSNTSVQQLGEAFLTIGANARNAKGGTTELSAVLGVLADNGIKGSEAGTHLRNIMLAMNPTTDKAIMAWEQLGVSAYDAEGNLRALPDVFGDLSQAMEGMTDQEKTDMFSRMFNKTDLASIQALVGTSAERFQELDLAIQGAWYSSASLEEGLNGVGLSMSGMEQNLSGLGITAEDIQTALDVSGGSAEEFVSYLADFSATGATTNEILSAMGTDLNNVQTAFDGVSGAAQAMADTQLDNLSGDITLAKSAFEGLQIAISDGIAPALRDVVSGASTFMQDLTTAISGGDSQAVFQVITDGLANGIKGAFDMLISGYDFIAEHADQIIQMGMGLVTTLVTGITSNYQGLLQAGVNAAIAFGMAIINYDWVGLGTELITAIQTMFPSNASELLQPMLDGFTAALPTLLDTGVEVITNLANGILEAAPGLLDTAADLIVQFVDFILQNLPAILSAGTTLLLNLVDGIINALPELAATAAKLVFSLLEALYKNYPSIIKAGFETLGKLIEGILNAIPKLLAAIVKICANVAQEFIKYDWIGLGKNIIQGIIDGVVALGASLINAILKLCSGALDAVKKFFGISSPSKVMANEVGKYIPEGIALGIEKNADAVTDAMAELKDDTLTAAATMDINTNTKFGDKAMSQAAILARMDAMLTLMEKYFPEMTSEGLSISEINRRLGAAYS